MITEIIVSNYRSIGENVRLKLGKMTALVGPNGSGKSNVADVFRFVADALSLGLEASIQKRHGIDAVRRWSSGRPFNLGIKISLKEPSFTGSYEFSLAGSSAEDYSVKSEAATVLSLKDGSMEKFRISEGKWEYAPSDLKPKITRQSLAMTLLSGDERFAPLAGALKNVSVYAVFPDALRDPQKPDTIRPMRQHGENWATVLQTLKSENIRADLIAALSKLTGDIDDYRVRQLGGYLNAEFRHKTKKIGSKDRQKWFEGAQESDGTLRVAGIITALLQEPPLTLIGIEEPELTVHVGAIPLLFDYLKQAAKRGQVLVTTHSVELLEKLDVDDIRVVNRRDGITTVAAVRDDQRKAVKDRLLSVGDIYAMEQGLQQQELDIDNEGDK